MLQGYRRLTEALLLLRTIARVLSIDGGAIVAVCCRKSEVYRRYINGRYCRLTGRYLFGSAVTHEIWIPGHISKNIIELEIDDGLSSTSMTRLAI